MTIHDGGVFTYTGTATDSPGLTLVVYDNFLIRGGGTLISNKINLEASTITIDDEGLLDVSNRGYDPGEGPGPGIDHNKGGSGASHGGRGGMGSFVINTTSAYDDVLNPTQYGSGGSIGGGTQNTGSGGGIVMMSAFDMMTIDGTIMANGGTSDQPRNGGASGGSINLHTDIFAGSGKIISNGGDGACVPHCSVCDSERRCLQCTDYKYWRDSNCINDCNHSYNRRNHMRWSSPIKTGRYCANERASPNEEWQIGGGGGGGRIGIYTMEENRFRGEIQAYGGKSYKESGGAGTIYISNTTPNGTETTLKVNNRDKKPLRDHLLHELYEDSGRTYIVTDASHVTDYVFDHVHINQGAHLVFEKFENGTTPVEIGKLYGDLTGMIHSSGDYLIRITDSQSPFPASFYIYEDSYMKLPKSLTVAQLDYQDIHLDGEMDGVHDLTIGRDINFHVGYEGHSSGRDKKTLSLHNLQIWADGEVQSWYPPDPYSPDINPDYPSLVLDIKERLHIHPGGSLQTHWLEVTADTILIDQAGVVDVSGQSRDYRNGGINSEYWGEDLQLLKYFRHSYNL
ncbi:uncharacterized protein [Ptychodera flava]|uniref:uncharacterized protein n=1 Tax=Ptychodera flava TaxID=63121 RepID=UPI00396AA3D4